MYTKSLLVATFLVLGATVAFTSECKMIWIFGIPCRDVYVTLVTQIKNWRNDGSCITGGQSCLYELVSTTPYMIKAKHTSPRTKFSNTFQIIFNPAEEATMCRVTGDSISDIFVDPVDSDINYCSLQNLIDGSGLSKVDGYKHFTNEYICVESHAPNCTIG